MASDAQGSCRNILEKGESSVPPIAVLSSLLRVEFLMWPLGLYRRSQKGTHQEKSVT